MSVCACACLQHCDSSGRKEVTHHLIFLERLSLRLAGYITDVKTERWPPPGRYVARNCSYTVPAALCQSCDEACAGKNNACYCINLAHLQSNLLLLSIRSII